MKIVVKVAALVGGVPDLDNAEEIVVSGKDGETQRGIAVRVKAAAGYAGMGGKSSWEGESRYSFHPHALPVVVVATVEREPDVPVLTDVVEEAPKPAEPKTKKGRK